MDGAARALSGTALNASSVRNFVWTKRPTMQFTPRNLDDSLFTESHKVRRHRPVAHTNTATPLGSHSTPEYSTPVSKARRCCDWARTVSVTSFLKIPLVRGSHLRRRESIPRHSLIRCLHSTPVS